MTVQEFQVHMNRLIEQFGKNTYSAQRTKLIYREVQDFSVRWWEKTVDGFILACRHAPLLDELAGEIGKEREVQAQRAKEQFKQDAKDFFAGTYHQDDAKHACQTIIKRINGNISDEDWAKFVELLEETARNSKEPVTPIQTCKDCDNSGLVFVRDEKNYEWVYRCYCSHGARRPRNYVVYDRDARKRVSS